MKVFDLHVFERHPYWTGGAVIIGGVAVWYFFLRGSTPAASGAVAVQQQPGTTEADYQQAVQVGAQLQMAQLSAATQITEQNTAANVQLQQDAYSFQLGKIQLQNASDATDKQFQLQEDALSTQAQMQSASLANQLAEQQAGYAASIEGLKIGANSAISQETIAANLQQNLSAINAQLQAHQSDNQTAQYTAQLNNEAIMNGQNVSAIMNGQDDNASSSEFGAIAGVAGLALMAFA